MAFNQPAIIHNNTWLREPQRLAWLAIQRHFGILPYAREVGVVLPVGCGKSGLITVTPFAVQANRVLVIALGLRIRQQLAADFSSSNPDNFYERFGVVPDGGDLPQIAVVERQGTNLDDLHHAQVVTANIQQLAREDNRWLMALEEDALRQSL